LIVTRNSVDLQRVLAVVLDSPRGALRQYAQVVFPPGTPATPTRTSVDIRRLPWTSRLASDYAFAFESVAPFYAGNPADPTAWRDRIAAVHRTVHDRPLLANILAAQQARRGAPAESVDAAANLADPRAVAVVTGQQAGLFGGPLFTLLKALTAIELASRVRDDYGVPAVPVFWVNAEDHDWNEVKTCSLLDGDVQLVSVALDDPDGSNECAINELALDASAPRAIEALEALLPAAESTPWLLNRLRRAYAPGRPMSDGFARWLEDLLGSSGLVVYDASDPAAKPLVAGLFEAEFASADRTSRLAARAGLELKQLGYHAQVSPMQDSVALFHLAGARTACRLDGDDVITGALRESRAAMADRARLAPEEFSPNVLLRPLVQDTIFPTVCYVAGPGELGYLGQLKAIYESFGMVMPLIQPRASVTLLDANAARFLARHEVPLASLRAQDEAALNTLLGAHLPAGVESAVAEAARTLAERMSAVASAVTAIDPTLEGATHSALGRMQDDIKKLQGKILQAAKRKDETLRRQFTRAQAQAFPGGHPQERAIGFVSFLNRVGPTLIDRLRNDLPLTEFGQHSLLTL